MRVTEIKKEHEGMLVTCDCADCKSIADSFRYRQPWTICHAEKDMILCQDENGRPFNFSASTHDFEFIETHNESFDIDL